MLGNLSGKGKPKLFGKGLPPAGGMFVKQARKAVCRLPEAKPVMPVQANIPIQPASSIPIQKSDSAITIALPKSVNVEKKSNVKNVLFVVMVIITGVCIYDRFFN